MLTMRGFFESRSRAQDAIRRGTVCVNGITASKNGYAVTAADCIHVFDPSARYVSRGALKLSAALDAFEIDVKEKTVLDLGSSTGGFTQVLLERSAKYIIAIDIGSNQMHPSLMKDPRVRLLERLNVRDLTKEHLENHIPDIIVCDLSFISLKCALLPALEIAKSGTQGIFLVKPQFEIGKSGKLNHPEKAVQAAHEISKWLEEICQWTVLSLIPCSITGKKGNQEYFISTVKN